MEKWKTFWLSYGRPVLITVVVSTILIDTWPYTPKTIRNRIDWYLDVTGLWQGSWSMFTPDPDRQNHRLKIVFEFQDGAKTEWHSPEWSEQNLWERFVYSRWTEYFDNVFAQQNSPAWPGMLDYFVGLRRKQNPDKVITRASLYVRKADIESPFQSGWRKRDAPLKWKDWERLHVKEYVGVGG